uniref:Toxin CcdB n=1 Tax=Phenylobacterium glaciei TaxID=2803784 RepID=A0A974S8F2_9CAUL|nr:CcdB family protein [Phenylobacterium glaciei]
MRQFDVYPNPSTRSRAKAPYVVVVQSHHLVAAPTVLVAPSC